MDAGLLGSVRVEEKAHDPLKASEAAEKKEKAPAQKMSPKSAKTWGKKDGVNFDNRDKEEKTDETYGQGVYEAKPSAGLSKAKKSAVVKDAKAGKDIGKPGKSFDKVAKSAGGGEKLQGHLTSGDFFDIAKIGFGEASFTISSVEYTKADRATIKGDLNLKGIKAPVTFSAVIRNADDKGFFAEAFMPFDRTLFGINYGIGMVDSEVQLAIHIYGTK